MLNVCHYRPFMQDTLPQYMHFLDSEPETRAMQEWWFCILTFCCLAPEWAAASGANARLFWRSALQAAAATKLLKAPFFTKSSRQAHTLDMAAIQRLSNAQSVAWPQHFLSLLKEDNLQQHGTHKLQVTCRQMCSHPVTLQVYSTCQFDRWTMTLLSESNALVYLHFLVRDEPVTVKWSQTKMLWYACRLHKTIEAWLDISMCRLLLHFCRLHLPTGSPTEQDWRR